MAPPLLFRGGDWRFIRPKRGRSGASAGSARSAPPHSLGSYCADCPVSSRRAPGEGHALWHHPLLARERCRVSRDTVCAFASGIGIAPGRWHQLPIAPDTRRPSELALGGAFTMDALARVWWGRWPPVTSHLSRRCGAGRRVGESRLVVHRAGINGRRSPSTVLGTQTKRAGGHGQPCTQGPQGALHREVRTPPGVSVLPHVGPRRTSGGDGSARIKRSRGRPCRAHRANAPLRQGTTPTTSRWNPLASGPGSFAGSRGPRARAPQCLRVGEGGR